MIVIGTRKHFEVINIYKLFCHKKCTVAASYNFVSTCATHSYRKSLPGHKSLVQGPIEVLFVLTPVAFQGLHFDM